MSMHLIKVSLCPLVNVEGGHRYLQTLPFRKVCPYTSSSDHWFSGRVLTQCIHPAKPRFGAVFLLAVHGEDLPHPPCSGPSPGAPFVQQLSTVRRRQADHANSLRTKPGLSPHSADHRAFLRRHGCEGRTDCSRKTGLGQVWELVTES